MHRVSLEESLLPQTTDNERKEIIVTVVVIMYCIAFKDFHLSLVGLESYIHLGGGKSVLCTVFFFAN